MRNSNLVLWLFFVGGIGFAVGLIIVAALRLSWRPSSSADLLAVGTQVSLTELDITLKKPIELDGLSKAAVYELRSEAVLTYPDLLTGSYQPSEAVFGQIIDGLPWWGLKGYAYYGSGDRSIDGLSEEARFILNPYLLVAADFYGLGNYSTPESNFNPALITDEVLSREDFPTYCPPNNLRWFPSRSRAEVHYNVTYCKDRVRPWVVDPTLDPYIYFDLISYNARDLGLGYVWVAYDESTNVSHWSPPTEVYEIQHYLHQGGSCGYPGGCNNMSPPSPAIDGIGIDAFPARMVVWLWRSRPFTIANPDFVFTIYFD